MNRFALSLLALFVVPAMLWGQQTVVDTPPSRDPAAAAFLGAVADLPPVRLPSIDRVRLERESRDGLDSRFAAPTHADLGLGKDGIWTLLPNGDRVWRLRLAAPEAVGLMMLYDDFYLPPGSRLYVYDREQEQILGAYSSLNNRPSRTFLTGFIWQSEAVIEYYEPRAVAGQGRIHIFRVDQAFRREGALRSGANEFGFGTSADCNTNINCAEGQPFAQEKRAVVRILMVLEEGTGYCTGTLVNNTRQDGRPYVLSAYHCQDGFTPLFDFYRFDFNYEASACATPVNEPGFQSLLGCTRRAGRRQNDFNLFELQTAIPASFQPRFLGWDRMGATPDTVYNIHHPRGDLKKIAYTFDAIRVFDGSIEWNNNVTTPPQHHFRVDYTFGTYEVGSSGSALLDERRRIVGQLHGGTPSCEVTTVAYFGRLSLSWEGGGTPETRLRDWLDPDSTGVMTLDALGSVPTQGFTIGGMVATETGNPVFDAQVLIVSNGGLALSTKTDSMGMYAFSDLPAGADYEVTVVKGGDAQNGISIIDLIRIQQHNLNVDLLDSPYQILAADVNNSGSISILDLILIQKVNVGIDAAFTEVPPWIFLPAAAQFVDQADPFQGIFSEGFVIRNLATDHPDFDFIAVKYGDVNGSASGFR